MPKVLITDHTFGSLDLEQAILQPVGATIELQQCRAAEQLAPLVADADAIMTQFAQVNAQVIANMKKAKVIARYGIGVDNVDLDAARAHGIPVCNVPDYCIDEVADHTLAFILGITRQVVTHCAQLRTGKWGLASPLADFRILREQTIGVVGFGRIGREVVHRLLAFRARVKVTDPIVSPAEIEKAGAIPVRSVDELLPDCDILTLHCPSNAKTRRMIDAAALARLKRGAVLINLARGDLVDTTALVAAMESGQVSSAALDVFDQEPLPPGHPLLGMPNVIVAPHIASVSPKAIKRLREATATAAAYALRGKLPPNVVNGVERLP